jgi:hypothetical protein
MPTKEVLAYRELERRKAKRDFWYFVDTYCMMYSKGGGAPIQFKLWDFQKLAATTFQKDKKIIVLKARQMGMSWLAMAYVVWCVLHKKNFHVYITSIGLKEVNEQMERIRFIWYNMPDWVRGEVTLGGKGNKDNDSLIEFSNGSAIHAIASTKSGGHGAAPGLYILDEFARKDNDVMAWRAIKPSLGKESQVIIISTSDGLNNLFADLWFGASSGSNEFTPVFFSATEHPDYSPDYLEEMRRDFAGDKQGYLEAFPMKPEDAFLASSKAVFDESSIRAWKEYIRAHYQKAPDGCDPLVGYLDEGNEKKISFTEDDSSHLSIWKHPNPAHRYCIGTDLAEGLTDGDWSVSVVLDTDTDEIVAMYRGKIKVEDYSYPVLLLARYYNNAWLVIETNRNSGAIMDDIKTIYPWLYKREHREKITDTPTLVPGFYMGSHNRTPVLAQLRRYFSDTSRPLRIYSDVILNEFTTFEEDTNKKAQAVKGKHDDCVIACALAVEGKRTMPSVIAHAGRGVQQNMMDRFTGRGRKSKRTSRSL